MKPTLFVSDLHLSAARRHISELFFDFLNRTAAAAGALYVLGDLFESWAGDDDLDDPLHASVVKAFKAIGKDGTSLYLMHGNRDFLIGEPFAEACGAKLLSDPTLVDLYGQTTLLMHGDTLCTDDVQYQRWREYSHDRTRQQAFLAQPLVKRKAMIEGLLGQSQESKRDKGAGIMDAAPAAIENALRKNGYPRLIHGHTHRPARHTHLVDGRECERWVLADWYDRGSYLRCNETGCVAVTL